MNTKIYIASGRALLFAVVPFLFACASLDPTPSLERVSASVAERSGQTISWTVSDEDRRAALQLINGPLDLEDAVRLALISSPELQARYQELGIAQAAWVQSGLLRNPVFDAGYRQGNGENELDIGIGIEFLDVFLIPLRKEAALADQQKAELAVTKAVLERISQVRQAWIGAVAARQQLNREIQALTLITSMDSVAEALFDAGNITRLERDTARLALAESTLRKNEAAWNAVNAQEQLAVLMGTWGEEVNLNVPEELPRLPWTETSQSEVENEAVIRSLELEIARQEIIAEAADLDLEYRETLIPSLEVGWSAERDNGEWKDGPVVVFALPIFDTGRAARTIKTARLEQLRRNYLQEEIEIRASTRKAQRELELRRAAVEHLIDEVLPLVAGQQVEMSKFYHATEVGLADVLAARLEAQRSHQRFVAALANYWQARERRSALLQGVQTDSVKSMAALMPTNAPAMKGGH